MNTRTSMLLTCLVAATLAACGGGGDSSPAPGPAPAPSPAPAPANQSPTAHIAPISGIKLVGQSVSLDGTASTDPESAPLTFQWSIVGRPESSRAALGNPTASVASIEPDLAGTYALQLVVSDGVSNSAPETIEVRVGTPVAGAIAGTTSWSLKNSPYVITGKLMIPAATALNIEPGVEVMGNHQDIQVQGTLAVNGTPSNKVTISDTVISPAGTMANNHAIRIRGAQITGGSVYAATGNAIYGTLELTDSRLSDLDTYNAYIYLWYPTGPSKIERNVFVRSGGISYGLSDVALTIRNNAFIEWKSPPVTNWAMYGSASADVSLNSFVSTDRIAVELPNGYTSAHINASRNYWGTTDIAVINKMIQDKNDDLTSSDYVTYLPILTAPDAATPSP